MSKRHYNRRASAMIKSLYEWDMMDTQDQQEWLDQSVSLIREGLGKPSVRLSAIRWYLKLVDVCLFKGVVRPVIVLHEVIRECVAPVQFLSQLEPHEQQIWVIAHAMSLAYNEGIEHGMNLCEQFPAPVQDAPGEFHPN